MVSSLAISAGNNQSGNPGAKIKLSVKVADSSGNGAAGVGVVFTVSSGSATLSSSTGVTGADGVASTTVTLGGTSGAVTVIAQASGLPTVTFKLTVNPVASTPVPQISTGGVVGASLSPGKRNLAVGGIASIFGQYFAPDGTARKVGSDDLVNGRVPVSLAGVCVEVGGVRAPVFAVYPAQVNFQAPNVPAGDSVTVQLITGCGATETRTNTVTSVDLGVRSGVLLVPTQRGWNESGSGGKCPHGRAAGGSRSGLRLCRGQAEGCSDDLRDIVRRH